MCMRSAASHAFCRAGGPPRPAARRPSRRRRPIGRSRRASRDRAAPPPPPPYPHPLPHRRGSPTHSADLHPHSASRPPPTAALTARHGTTPRTGASRPARRAHLTGAATPLSPMLDAPRRSAADIRCSLHRPRRSHNPHGPAAHPCRPAGALFHGPPPIYSRRGGRGQARGAPEPRRAQRGREEDPRQGAIYALSADTAPSLPRRRDARQLSQQGSTTLVSGSPK